MFKLKCFCTCARSVSVLIWRLLLWQSSLGFIVCVRGQNESVNEHLFSQSQEQSCYLTVSILYIRGIIHPEISCKNSLYFHCMYMLYSATRFCFYQLTDLCSTSVTWYTRVSQWRWLTCGLLFLSSGRRASPGAGALFRCVRQRWRLPPRPVGKGAFRQAASPR